MAMLELIFSHWVTYLFLFWMLVIVIGNLWPKTGIGIRAFGKATLSSRIPGKRHPTPHWVKKARRRADAA
jgi:hypothetical protein